MTDAEQIDRARRTGKCTCELPLRKANGERIELALFRAGEIAIASVTLSLGGIGHAAEDCTAIAEVTPGDGVNVDELLRAQQRSRDLVPATLDPRARAVVWSARQVLGAAIVAREGDELIRDVEKAREYATEARVTLARAGESLPGHRKDDFVAGCRSMANAESIAAAAEVRLQKLHARWQHEIAEKLKRDRHEARLRAEVAPAIASTEEIAPLRMRVKDLA